MEGFGFPGPGQPSGAGWLLVTATCPVLAIPGRLYFPFPCSPSISVSMFSILHCRDGGSSSISCGLSPLSLPTVQGHFLFLCYRPSLLFLLPHFSFLPHLESVPNLEWISGPVLNQRLLVWIWSHPRPPVWSTPGMAAFQWQRKKLLSGWLQHYWWALSLISIHGMLGIFLLSVLGLCRVLACGSSLYPAKRRNCRSAKGNSAEKFVFSENQSLVPSPVSQISCFVRVDGE